MSAILLGNGLNRCIEGYPSWESLLRTLGNEFFYSIGRESNPLLQFDMMMCNAYREHGEGDSEFRLWQLLKELNIENLTPDDADFLASVAASGVKTILTTNYDYNLENALFYCPWSPYRDNELVNKYQFEHVASDKRHALIGDLEIHHIHGELNYRKSICLGITKYIDNLAKTMELLSFDDSEMPATNLQRLIVEEVFSRTGWKKTWAELLFNTDIYIVGLGLSEAELDLWWLLMRRAQLLSYKEFQGKITNHIYYFSLTEGDAADTSSLEALGITVKPFSVIDGNWKGAYRDVWNEIYRMENRGMSDVTQLTVS